MDRDSDKTWAADEVLQALRRVAVRNRSVSKAVLFGSRARGDANPASDYDIAVMLNDAAAEPAVREELEELPTLNKIDAVFLKQRHLGTPFYSNIMREGKVIVDKFGIKLENFQKALARLREGIGETEQSESLTLRDGCIQRFEFTAELAWKAAREYLLQQGLQDINSPKPVMREAFHNGLVSDEQGWLQLLQDRNLTSHLYDEQEADEIFLRIKQQHLLLLTALVAVLAAKTGKDED